MRVGLDASVVFSSVGGTRTYAIQLIGAMLEEKPDWQFHLYTRDAIQAEELRSMWPHANAHAKAVSGKPNSIRLQMRLPAALRDDGIEVYHSLGYFLPLGWNGAKVVTIHDMNVYASWRNWLRPKKVLNWADMAAQIPLAARSARKIITDSAASKELIQRVLRVKAGKLVVVPLAPDAYFDGEPASVELAEASRLVGDGRFVLFVGIIATQKNLPMLVRAFASSGIANEGCRLVLAGSDREGEGAVVRRVAANCGVEDSVVLTGYVSRSVLRALYHRALVTVLPSHGEGFGLPLVEAMAAGSPVMAARTQSLPEVVGDGGELFPPGGVSELANMFERVALDEKYRQELVRRARARRPAFSWAATARATTAVYEEVLSSRR